MTDTINRLDTDDVWRAVGAIDPVAAVAEELIGRTLDRADHESRAPGRLVDWPGPGDHVGLQSDDGTVGCVAPASSLCHARSAALVALAARELLVPGGLTVAVVGASGPTQPQLAMIARHVQDISHLALWPVASYLLAPALRDQLELAGVRISVPTSLAGALFGANLVIVVGDGIRDFDGLRSGQFAWGAVLVNATGQDLPAELVDRIDDVYVDDLGLIEANRHRYVVGRHFKEPSTPKIVADLGLLLTDRARRGRHTGAAVLVELLGVAEPSVEFVHRVCRAARRAGLGARVPRRPA
jgi:ornithine cyclodeaminase/alanine dehydrogenase-like protein (mu-crystallin family)